MVGVVVRSLFLWVFLCQNKANVELIKYLRTISQSFVDMILGRILGRPYVIYLISTFSMNAFDGSIPIF